MSAVRLGMPDKLKQECIFGALNGEVVLEMEYRQIMGRPVCSMQRVIRIHAGF